MRLVVSWFLITLCVACDEGGSARPSTDAGADAGNPCNACPDPLDPRVHYLHPNPNDCKRVPGRVRVWLHRQG
jgi:hypothetical protein